MPGRVRSPGRIRPSPSAGPAGTSAGRPTGNPAGTGSMDRLACEVPCVTGAMLRTVRPESRQVPSEAPACGGPHDLGAKSPAYRRVTSQASVRRGTSFGGPASTGRQRKSANGGRRVNIVVTVKQVPDTWAEKKLDPSDKTTDRKNVENVMNEMDEYGVEEALRIKEAHGGEVTVVSMGPEKAVETIRKALSMGADKAVHLTDDALHGSDAIGTSEALAKVISGLSPDLVIPSSEASDARGGVMGALLAERLGFPQLTLARKVTVDPGSSKVTIERQGDNGYAVVEGSLPAVVGVVEKINEPRYPSFKGIMAAKKKPLTTMSSGDAGIDAGSVGLANATTGVDEAQPRPPKSAGQRVKDEGDGGTKIAEFLVSQKLI